MITDRDCKAFILGVALAVAIIALGVFNGLITFDLTAPPN